jgi:hypothetical protein
MNRPCGHCKTASNLSQSADHQLNMYVLAATAAGVGLLVLAQSAEAKIVYTPIHHVIGKKGQYKLDLNHDKLSDFILLNTRGCNTDYCIDALSAIPSAGNGVEGAKGFLSIPYAFAPKRGAKIGPNDQFSGRLLASSQSNQGTIGQWINVTNRYLGLKFTIKGKVHFGWARLTVRVLGGAFIKTTITGYAYETIPNKPIIAGRIKGPEESGNSIGHPEDVRTAPAPEPATLGALAMGASGLSIWRRKESSDSGE